MVSALALLAVTNDANWVAFGGAGAFAPHKTIHMLGEDINIKVYDDKIHVRVYFSFENRGPATTVKMAFPFEDTAMATGKSFLRFATKVDGMAVGVDKIAMVPITREGQEFKKQGYDIAQAFVYVKTVEFSENQRRTVLVDYATNHGYAGTGWQSNEYILHTGATWAGSIGTCTITVDWTATSTISKPALEFYSLKGKRIQREWTYQGARIATVTLQNIEPDYDLSLTSMDGFWNVMLNGKELPQYRGHSGGTGPILTGDPRDPFIYTFGLQTFFDSGDGYDQYYFEGPEANAFGNYFGVRDVRTIVDGLGNNHRLKREFVDWHEHEERVRLKDLVEALGGTFRWNAEMERVEITLPTRATPLRKKGDPIPPSHL